MSIQALSNINPLLQTPTTNRAAQTAPAAAPATEKTVLGTDKNQVLEIKRGLVPTLKGAGAGALGGAVAAGVPLFLMSLGSSGNDAGWAQLFAIAGAAGGAVAGGVAGGVTANTTDSKWKGALVGAGVGALAGGLGLAAKNLATGNFGEAMQVGLVGAVVGGVTGAAGGFAGSLTAQRK